MSFSLEKDRDMEAKKYHVMMFPWLAFGHMIPFLELSKRLAAKGVLVSYVSTPKNLQRLVHQTSENLETKINFHEIPLPQVDGLPQNCEATVDLQENQTPYLKTAYDLLAKPFEDLLQKVEPDLILLDFAACKIPEVAAKFDIPVAFFCTFTAAFLAYLGPPSELKSGKQRPSLDEYLNPSLKVSFPSFLAEKPDYAVGMMRGAHNPDKISGFSSAERTSKVVEASAFVVVRTCEEFEGDYMNLVRKFYQKPVLPIGVLPPFLEEKKNNAENEMKMFHWLDGRKPKSVLFVGFGSEYKMPVEQIHELAFSLEISEIPFLWILRRPLGMDGSRLLPVDFEERIGNRGVVVHGWAPQLEILSHAAIGGCLFHSGWGTIIESLGFGHPLVLLPMLGDQGLNCKLLVEKGVGFEVPRNEDGSFSREVVAGSIRQVLVGREGEKMRLKAAEMRGIFGNQESQDCCIGKFIEHIGKCSVLKGKKEVERRVAG